MDEANLKELLINGAAELGVSLSDQAADRLFKYKELLKEYNKKVNLTSIVDDEQIIIKHFLDSLTVVPELKADARIIDIGTGAGFPGVVLKIALENTDLLLLDSLNKRIKFLKEVVCELGLSGVECIHARAEELWRKEKGFKEGFDYAVSRAVAKLSVLSGYCLPYVKINGEFIAMKGPDCAEEAEEARKKIKLLGGEVLGIKQITLPGSDITHSLVKIKKTGLK